MVECVFEPTRNHRLTDDQSLSLSAGRRPEGCSHPDPSFNVPDTPLPNSSAVCSHPPPVHFDTGFCASCRVFIVGVLQGVMGMAKSVVRWEVMAMAKPPLQRHYCTSAPNLCHSLYSGWAQTNLRMIICVCRF